MRIVTLDSLEPGMVLAKPVFGGEGQVLLQSDVEIKTQYISYLKQIGVNYFYVKDNRVRSKIVDDVMRDEVRQMARLLMKDITNSINLPSRQKGLLINDKKVLKVLSRIMDELLAKEEIILQLFDIRGKDDYLFAHSVNCTVMAILVGKIMNFTNEDLQSLALGTLLHDLGIIAVPNRVLQKSGELTLKEFSFIEDHPIVGYQIFKSSPLFTPETGKIILQHHERYNGGGYPQRLAGIDISPLAQITAIADMYDALTSERPYRKAFLPHQAIDIMQGYESQLFHPRFLHQFLSIIAAYPVGSHVMLSNGESGLVVHNRPGYTLSPIVRVLYLGEDLAPHSSPYDLDLTEALDIKVVNVLR